MTRSPVISLAFLVRATFFQHVKAFLLGIVKVVLIWVRERYGDIKGIVSGFIIIFPNPSPAILVTSIHSLQVEFVVGRDPTSFERLQLASLYIARAVTPDTPQYNKLTLHNQAYTPQCGQVHSRAA